MSAPGDLHIATALPNSAGGLEAQGTASPGAKVRLMLNGSYIAEVVADALGRWSLTVEHGLTTGLYALRAEALDASGRAKAATGVTFAVAPRRAGGGPIATAPSPAPPSVIAQDIKGRPTDAAPAAASPLIARPAFPLGDAATPPSNEAIPAGLSGAAAPLNVAKGDPSHAVVAELRTATVIKGDNLWDLARHFYGDGLHYADIFQANAVQIRNPNLIYIGQVFVVPQASVAAR